MTFRHRAARACPARSANPALQKHKETIMTESIADLEKRRDLLKEIKDLSESHLATLKEINEDYAAPTDDEIRFADGHLATLKELQDYAEPTDDEINAAYGHLNTLKEIAETDSPTDDEIKAAGDHLATLKEIENA
jgi:hypothetical protein